MSIHILSVISSAAVDPITDEESRMDKLIVDFPLLRPLFARVFCMPAISAPVDRIFSQSGIIMSARRARMSSSLFEALMFLKCNAQVAWWFDRELNESNDYVAKLTMLSTVYLHIVSPV